MHDRLWRRLAGPSVLLVALVAGGAGNGRPADKTLTYPKRVLIIRHAEKTDDKATPDLAPAGVKRAGSLPALFEASGQRPMPFPTPDFIFAATDSKKSHRPVLTVTPLARKLKLPIVSTFDKANLEGLAAELFENPKYAGKVVLIAWRHGNIPKLAAALKATGVPKVWEDGVYDRVWQIAYDKQGKATFKDLPQHLMPGDAPE